MDLISICNELKKTYSKDMTVEELKAHPKFLYTNPEEELEQMENPYDGTFNSILHMVKHKQIIVVINDFDEIMGFEVLTNSGDLHVDNLQAELFKEAYARVPIMDYVILATLLTVSGATVTEIENDGDWNLKIHCLDETGKEHILNSHGTDLKAEREIAEALRERGEAQGLPERVVIENCLEKGIYSVPQVKTYLREKYNHYLAKGYEPDISRVEDHEHHTSNIVVSNIRWGRKI